MAWGFLTDLSMREPHNHAVTVLRTHHVWVRTETAHGGFQPRRSQSLDREATKMPFSRARVH